MKSPSPALLRTVLSALAAALFLTPLSATGASNGSDGEFRPTVSTVLDANRLIFNFTDIIIPYGVTVSFGGIASGRQLALLASGSIDIAGVLDAGSNALLIEAPRTFSLAGSVHAGALTVALTLINLNQDSLPGAIGSVGGDLTIPGRDVASSGGGSVVIVSPPGAIAPPPGAIAPPPGIVTVPPATIRGDVDMTSRGADLIIVSSPIDLGPITTAGTVSAVPEPDVAAMLVAGAGLLLGVVRRRRPGSAAG